MDTELKTVETPSLPPSASSLSSPEPVRHRPVVFRTAGRQNGPINRLVSPSHLGQRLKPFVFLDHAVFVPESSAMMGIHPHSGIATLTTVLRGGISYEDTTGKRGELHAGGLECMKAGNGVWHDGGGLPGEEGRLFQLWVALPPALENSAPESQYVAPAEVQYEGPVRVILGQYGQARSVIRAPDGINYFHVRLENGQRWRYQTPVDHTVAWLAIDQGRLHASETIDAGELAVFEEGDRGAIDVVADGPTSFVIGTAVKHPYPLVLGYYSVHTSPDALARGETEIQRIGGELRKQGRL